MESVRVWLTTVAEPGFVVQTGSIGHQGISLPVADGVAHPGRLRILEMAAPIGKDLADIMAVFEQDKHAPGSVNELDGIQEEIDSRHAGWKTLEIRIVRVNCGDVGASGPIG